MRDEQIRKLQSENEDLQELAQHVQYMADMIEVHFLSFLFSCFFLGGGVLVKYILIFASYLGC